MTRGFNEKGVVKSGTRLKDRSRVVAKGTYVRVRVRVRRAAPRRVAFVYRRYRCARALRNYGVMRRFSLDLTRALKLCVIYKSFDIRFLVESAKKRVRMCAPVIEANNLFSVACR